MGSDLSVALNATHRAMIAQIQADEDKILADRLENFYNKVIYRREMSAATSTLGSVLDKYLTEELAVKVSQSMKIPDKPKYTWQSLEQDIGTITQKAINNIFNKRSRLSSAQSGTSMAYVPILENLADDIKDDFLKELSLVEDGPNTRTYARMGKNDVLITSSLKSDLESELAILENLSLSIKNYSGTIKLEAVNPLKGYMAVMQHYKKFIKEDIDLASAYVKYYNGGDGQDDPEVTMHINHLINIYALTGLGNFDLATGNFSTPTRFLVMNTGKNIRVFSTAEIIQDVLNGGTTYLFGKKKSRRKNTRDMITLKKVK